MNTEAFVCLRTVDDAAVPLPDSSVLCLGNFDGVHPGHQALLRRGAEMAKERGVACGVFLFDPPSSDYLCDTPPGHLTTRCERSAMLSACGISFYIAADFSAMRDMPPELFAQSVLRDQLCAVGLVCGYNFRFGAGGRGDTALLRGIFGAENVSVIPCVSVDDRAVSASAIRSLLLGGKAEEAAVLLGRPYTLNAPVNHGKELARHWGMPTANQFFPAGKLIPAPGVYYTHCTVDGTVYDAVSNVGIRPSVSGDTHIPNCESYLLNFTGDLYGKQMQTAFLHFVRPEVHFSSPDQLRTQMRADIDSAGHYFAKGGRQ